MSTPTDGPPVSAGVRVARLAQNVAALLRLRLQDTRADVMASARRLVGGALLALAAVVLALLALPLLIIMLILILAVYLPAWAATGVVLLAVLLAAGALGVLARRRLRWRWPDLLADLQADVAAIREALEDYR
ncbi:MAG TPA: phage holin family protein [bacterium]|nr:phage holin family protein [bacterium]